MVVQLTAQNKAIAGWRNHLQFTETLWPQPTTIKRKLAIRLDFDCYMAGWVEITTTFAMNQSTT